MKHWLRNSMKDVHTLPGTDIATGHNLLVANIYSTLKNIIHFQNGKPRWDVEKLYEQWQEVQDIIEQNSLQWNMEEHWNNIKKCVLDTVSKLFDAHFVCLVFRSFAGSAFSGRSLRFRFRTVRLRQLHILLCACQMFGPFLACNFTCWILACYEWHIYPYAPASIFSGECDPLNCRCWIWICCCRHRCCHHPCYYLYAGYSKLHTWNKPCC